MLCEEEIMIEERDQKRQTMSRIYRNSEKNLMDLKELPPRESNASPELVRPKSASFDPGVIQEALNSVRKMSSIRKMSTASTDSDEQEEIFGWRNILSDSKQDVIATPVVISPVTISRCICTLVIEYVKKSNHSTYDETKDGRDDDHDGEIDLSVLDVFRRARAHMPFMSTEDECDNTPPLPDLMILTDFFMKICVDSQMEYECSVIAYIYLTRMLKISRHVFVFSEETYKGVVLASMVLANKVWDDFAMMNSEYCSIFYGLTLQRVNELELAMLLVLRNDLWVSRREYAAAHFSVQELITKDEIERVRNLPSNRRVPVMITKTALSREKSRSVLSEASSAVASSTHSGERWRQSMDSEEGFLSHDFGFDLNVTDGMMVVGAASPEEMEMELEVMRKQFSPPAISVSLQSSCSRSYTTPICSTSSANNPHVKFFSPDSSSGEIDHSSDSLRNMAIAGLQHASNGTMHSPPAAVTHQPVKDVNGASRVSGVVGEQEPPVDDVCCSCVWWPWRSRPWKGNEDDGDQESAVEPGDILKKKSFSDVGVI